MWYRDAHLGPPGAPSWPEAAIFYDIWGHFGVTLELILETVGVFFDPCRLQEPKKGLGQALRTRTAFSSILGFAPRRSGGFSLQRELCFHFGGQWRLMSIFGSIFDSFWEPKPQLSSLWGLPEFG